MLFNNMAYLPVKSGRQPNIERLQILPNISTRCSAGVAEMESSVDIGFAY